VSDDEIIARCTRALADSGAELLRTGIALRPGDVDIVWIYGYGFPPHHGGPMHYAAATGYTPKGETTKSTETKELTHA
jgi:3-hydroxyacyl-CoA dehydrogenase